MENLLRTAPERGAPKTSGLKTIPGLIPGTHKAVSEVRKLTLTVDSPAPGPSAESARRGAQTERGSFPGLGALAWGAGTWSGKYLEASCSADEAGRRHLRALLVPRPHRRAPSFFFFFLFLTLGFIERVGKKKYWQWDFRNVFINSVKKICPWQWKFSIDDNCILNSSGVQHCEYSLSY